MVLNGILKDLTLRYHSIVFGGIMANGIYPSMVVQYPITQYIYHSVVSNVILKGLPLIYQSMVFGSIMTNGI